MASTLEPPPRVSVEYLVRQWNRQVDPAEQWFLGIVQRDEVWTPEQKSNLLDSLLKAYPIGSILLGRSGDGSGTTTVYVRDGSGSRTEAEVTADTWQILDGQQRMSSLAAMFSREETVVGDERGHLQLDMTDPDSDMHWIEPGQSKLPKPANRSQRVDLSGWSEFLHRHDRTELDRGIYDDELLRRLLADLDEQFTTELTGERADVARARWQELLDLWSAERVPVLSAPVRSPEQLLEVFKRVNLGGTDVSQADIYYAAVRTFWPTAETSLQRIVAGTNGLLDRFAVLEFASRFARIAFGAADPVNVNVDILNGKAGQVLRQALEDMCADGSDFVLRLVDAATGLEESSRLGWGLRLVHRRSIAAVLGWAIASPAADRRGLIADSAAEIDAFLAGTTLFRYRTHLRDRFDRVAFREAIASGQAGLRFPGERIRDVLRHELGDEQFAAIDACDTRANYLETGNRHPSLILSVVQQWPVAAENLHLDHIYADAASKRDMVIDGPYGRKRTHPLRSLTVNSLGNYWLLPAPTNESLNADRPEEKFDKLNRWLSDPGHPVPARQLWTIDPLGDETAFKQVAAALNPFPGNDGVNEAMNRFQSLIESRAHRIVKDFLQILPGSGEFARQVSGPTAEPSDVSEALAVALGLERLRLDFEAESHPLPHAGLAPTPALPWPEAWAGRQQAVQNIWHAVCEHQKEGRHNPAQDGGDAGSKGFAYCRYIKVTRDHGAWFGVRLEVKPGDPSPLAVSFLYQHGSYSDIRWALLQSSLDEWVPAGETSDITIPVPLDPGIPDKRAVEAVIDFFYRLDTILAARPGAAG